MKIPFVDLKAQYISIKNEIDNAINSVISETAFIKGKYVDQFEYDFSEAYEIKNVIGCANGTDAIYIALKSLGIGHGDEVITVANSWISSSETITQTGARVVFVDIEPDFFNIDCSKIEEKITEKTKAIIPVHLFGQPANMNEIIEIAKKYNLRVIEDCAQAHFAKLSENKVGTFGDIATFSFFPGKNLGAYGDAGGIITNDEDLAIKCRMFAGHGALIKHEHEIEGINSRLDGIQAAILSVKLKYIKDWTSARINHAEKYSKLLSPIETVVTPTVRKHAKHVFHLYVIRAQNRDELQSYLKTHGVSTGIHYPTPLPFLKSYEYLSHLPDDFPVAYKYQNEILSLPMYPEMRDDDIYRIVEIISSFYSK